MTENERIKYIQNQIKNDEICLLYHNINKPFSNIK